MFYTFSICLSIIHSRFSYRQMLTIGNQFSTRWIPFKQNDNMIGRIHPTNIGTKQLKIQDLKNKGMFLSYDGAFHSFLYYNETIYDCFWGQTNPSKEDIFDSLKLWYLKNYNETIKAELIDPDDFFAWEF